MAMDGVSAIDSKRPTRMVAIGYLILTTAVGLFLEHLMGAIFNALRWNDKPLVGDWTVSSLLGFVIAIGIAVAVWTNPRLNGLSFEVAQELRKVSWPSMEDTRANTIAVIVFSFAAAGIMGLFDFLSSKIMTSWIPTALDWLTHHA
jgi:preprotein translocase subunit SecE